MERISYIEFEDKEFEPLLQMSLKLWTDYEKEELISQLKQTTQQKKNKIYLAKAADGKRIGFSIFSLRTDYVEGADQSPTGYLEGIFVEPDHRGDGIAREFIKMGESWCKAHGCTQMGSDTWLTHKESRAFHKKVGFWEEEEIVHFLKDIT